MASGWTCGRCSAQNSETAVSCQNCGMIRGGVVTAPNPTSAPPAPDGWGNAPVPPVPGAGAPGGYPGAPIPPLQQTSAKKQAATGCLANIGIRLAILGVIAVIGAGIAFFTNAGRDSSGTINKAGDLKPADLQVGDCYDLPGESGNADSSAVIENTRAMPCSQPHHYEVFYRGSMTGDTYPDQPSRRSWVETNCIPAFETYVGSSVDTTKLTFFLFYPDDTSWSSGDRGAQCALADDGGAALTGSMKGSKR